MATKKVKPVKRVVNKEASYSINASEIIDDNDSNLRIENNEGVLLEADIEEMPGSCGILVIVGLDASFKISEPQIKGCAEMLDILCRRSTQKNNSTITFIVTTATNHAPSRKWEQVLARTKTFQKVKQFPNRRTGNMITVWMSNN